MKRWNWPTTILYIKHKKANLKQGCSKLVGKKRKAPTGGWSGGLNCPIGTGKKKRSGMSVSQREGLPDLGTAGLRHSPGGHATAEALRDAVPALPEGAGISEAPGGPAPILLPCRHGSFGGS